jgi:hypothetical protein
MKLSDFKTIVNESRVPVDISMTIGNIIRDGKITDTVQAVMLANAILFLKKATDNSEWSNFDQYRPNGEDGNIVQDLKATDPHVQVELAKEVMAIITSHNMVPVLGSTPSACAFVSNALRAQR